MILIYEIENPLVVFATHDNWQKEDVLSAYDGAIYGSITTTSNVNLSVGDSIPSNVGDALVLRPGISTK